MTAPRWVPIHLRLDATQGLCAESIPVLGEGPVEPLFFQSVERWLERPASLLFRTDASLAELVERARSAPPIRVAGIVAHLSYCGSTLIAQALAPIPGVVVLSEPATLDRVLRFGAPAIDPAERVQLVRALVIATAMPFLPDGGAVVLKPEAIHTAYLPLLRAAFPEAAWVFAHRSLGRVVASNLRNASAALQPGAVDPTLFGLPVGADRSLSTEDYAAAIVAGMARSALAHDTADPGLFVDHAMLDAAMIERIALHFGLPLDEAARATVAARLRHDAKEPTRRYVADDALPALALTPEIAAYVDEVQQALRERTVSGPNGLR